jgi:hypothetical protein
MKSIETVIYEITSANTLKVEAGTTGYMGGDSGHGGRTYFKIRDLGSTDIKVGFTDKYNLYSTDGFYVELGGDCELDTMITALSCVIKILVCQLKNIDINKVSSLVLNNDGSISIKSDFEYKPCNSINKIENMIK